jgi:thiamine-monophosphate kinase
VSDQGNKEGRHPLGPEFELIDRLTARLPDRDQLPQAARESLVLGVGDDAAVWRLPSGEAAILTVDTLVEGVHAWPSEPAADVGARALTGAASDIAAMGGIPHLALVALQAPGDAEEDRLLQMYDGLTREAGLLGVAVVGGDVVDTPGPLAVAIVVYGMCKESEVWSRSGAQVGDLVALTGNLGGSRGGLELHNILLNKQLSATWADELHIRKASPHARIEATGTLQNSAGVHACIDISDGLSSDAWHMALASGVTVRLERGAIPLHPAVQPYLAWQSKEGGSEERDPVHFALDSGEEYELLIAVDGTHPAVQEGSTGLGGTFGLECGVPLTVVGRIEEGPPAVVLVDGDIEGAVEPGGHTHRRPDGGQG